MLYCDGVSELSSVLSLPTRTRPENSPASSSIVGAKRRHGPHHGAQKSTSTGWLLWRTSDWKLLSVISRMPSAMIELLLLQRAPSCSRAFPDLQVRRARWC